jgi:cell division septum initiation protein DivIVA
MRSTVPASPRSSAEGYCGAASSSSQQKFFVQGCGRGPRLATLPVRYRMADVGRFEQNQSDTRHLPETLGVATEGLRSTIELEVAKIVESAEARAAEIEDQALENASRLEQNSERRLEAAFQDSRQRLTQMLSEIDAVEASLGQAVSSLRAEAQRITTELSRAATEPFEPPDPPTAEVDSGETEEESPADVAEPDESALITSAIDPAVREMIQMQLRGFAETGRTRADAERMLLRFHQGEQYFDLLDEIYPEDTPGRRGFLRRRKARD